MKNLILTFAALVSLTVVSCRQADDILSNEDVTTIQIIEANRTMRMSAPDMKNDTINNNNTINRNDGEIAPPPRK